jgi:Kp4 protein
MKSPLSLLTPLLILTPSVLADETDALLGINCRGSGGCTSACGDGLGGLINLAKNLNDNSKHYNAENILCIRCKGAGEICAFPQNIGGGYISGNDVKNKLQSL